MKAKNSFKVFLSPPLRGGFRWGCCVVLFLLLISATPTRVRKADQAEWLKYSAWCRKIVPDSIRQVGYFSGAKRTVWLIDGTDDRGVLHHAGDTTYFNVNHPDTTWFICQCNDYQQNSLRIEKTLTYQIPFKKVALVRKKVCHVRQRRATVKDFYEWWMVPGDKYYKVRTPQVTIVQQLKIVK